MNPISRFILFLFLLSGITYAQQSLKDQLWGQVNECYSNFEDVDEDGTIDATIIDDSKNGYLSVEGEWPTCGCGCKNQAGAYTLPGGGYFILKNEAWGCAWKYGISSNKPIEKYFPEGFGLKMFCDDKIPTLNDTLATFYISAEIPQKGTKTKIHINLIPLGMNQNGKGGITYLIQENGYNRMTMLYDLKSVLQQLSGQQAIYTILDGKLSDLDVKDQNLLQKYVSTSEYGLIQNMNDYTRYLKQIHYHYSLYNTLSYSALILDWDTNNGRFKVVSKVPAEGKVDFVTFIQKALFWSPMC